MSIAEQVTREDYLEYCKKRAREYIQQGDYEQAYTSMASDLGLHPETQHHAAIKVGMQLLMNGLLDTEDQITRFIDGFH